MEAQQQPTAHGKRSGAARRKLKKERQAMLDAQFAGLEIDPMKGWKLPPELVHYMMHHFVSPPSGWDSQEGGAHRAFLSTLSLVCSLWREEAQKLPWKLAVLNLVKDVESYLSGGPKMHSTEILSIGGREDESRPPDSAELVHRVLASTADLVVLVLNKVQLNPTDLMKPNLASVSSTFTVDLGQYTLALLFRLQHLVLQNLTWTEQRFPTHLLLRLLESTTYSVRLKVLPPEDQRHPPHPTNRSSVPHFPSAPHPLHSLNLSWMDPSALVAFAPFISRLQQLIHLSLDFTNPELLESFPSCLTILSIKLGSRPDLLAKHFALSGGYRSLFKLKKCEIFGRATTPEALDFVKGAKSAESKSWFGMDRLRELS